VSILDLDAIADAAAERVAAKVLKALPALLRAELDSQRKQEVLSSADVAKRYGKTTEAFNAWLRRPGGAHVAAKAKVHNGRRTWLRVELELLESERGGGR
jgi:DNA-binding transcriptional regulator YiaG